MISTELKSGLDCSVLVLNKHYMAIRIVKARRAFSLLFRELAEVVSFEEGNYANYNLQSWCDVSRFKRDFEPDGHDWVATVNFHIAVPRIIRLLFYDRLPRNEVKFNRRNIFARDKNCCQYCGKRHPTSELSLDHVIPRSMGGESVWSNIVCACLRCNVKKGGRTPKQARLTLIKKPVKPKRNPLIHIHLGHQRYQSWKQFLDHAYWSVELK
ncbi:MAG: HNH endonuclease [Planctomycetota bacterium]|jgi:5-methylcytosine-specific restriction endonuclease McrA